jgi:hypothetical protein
MNFKPQIKDFQKNQFYEETKIKIEKFIKTSFYKYKDDEDRGTIFWQATYSCSGI